MADLHALHLVCAAIFRDLLVALSIAVLLAPALGAMSCSGEDGTVQTASGPCLGCHPAATLMEVRVTGSAREVADQLGDGFLYEAGFRVTQPRRGAHAARDLDACASCHVGHSNAQDFAQNRNIYPPPALNTLYQGGTDCASGCHDWLKVPVFQTGFVNLFGFLPYWEGDLDPYRLLESSSNALLNSLLSGDDRPRHRLIFREGWAWDGKKPLPFTTTVDRVSPGCGGCHDLSQEARHGEVPSCNDCHWFRRDNPAGGNGRGSAHELLVATTEAFLPLSAPSDRNKGACVFCHASGENGEHTDDPLTRRQCYNCHVSGHHTLNAPAIVQYWETLPIGEKQDVVREKEAEFHALHPQS